MSIYMPDEDSFLLKKEVERYAKGVVLDMGTGSGIEAKTAAENKNVTKVIAVDINKDAVEYCKKNNKDKKLEFKFSDLFSEVKRKFDTIIFNPPYLPEDHYEKDIALTGGKKGYETAERFLDKAGSFLKEDGIILLLFSSLTNKEKIEEIIENNAFVSEKLLEKGVGLMEKLYIYLIKKSELLKRLEKIGIKEIIKFAKGKRGVIYTGKFKNKKVAIKTQRPDVSVKTIENEVNCLKKLEKEKIGPKLVYSEEDFFVYEFIEGEFIEDFVEKQKTKKKIKDILMEVMNQCRTLDRLKMNKEEMHHPHKHVIITKNNIPALVDFERCKFTSDPKNVSQFCQYLISRKMSLLLKDKNIIFDRKKVIDLARSYKKDFSDKSFKKILEVLI